MESPKHHFSDGFFCFLKTDMDPQNSWFVYVSFSVLTFPGVLSIPSRELTYEKESHLQICLVRGICEFPGG